MAVYYKKIKGRNYDGKMIDLAQSMVKGKGDGRISLKDAKIILRWVKDSDEYTDIEKNTMSYIRDNYSFTPEADKWFRTEISKWAAAKGSIKKKKQAKKAAKAVKKSRISVSRERKSLQPTESFDEIYRREHTELLQQTRTEVKPRASAGGKKKFLITILVVLALCVIFAIGLFLSPKTKERLKEYLGSGSGASTKIKGPEITEEKTAAAEEKTPLIEEQKAAAPVQPKKLPAPLEQNAEYYTVQVKDDLVAISERLFKDYSRWKEIYEANRDIIKNPYMIYPGQKLKIPARDSKK
jgi:nucleoid-associated protein YgaU